MITGGDVNLPKLNYMINLTLWATKILDENDVKGQILLFTGYQFGKIGRFPN